MLPLHTDGKYLNLVGDNVLLSKESENQTEWGLLGWSQLKTIKSLGRIGTAVQYFLSQLRPYVAHTIGNTANVMKIH